jgi:hypothetical protein
MQLMYENHRFAILRDITLKLNRNRFYRHWIDTLNLYLSKQNSNYLTFQSFKFGFPWCRLFQKRVVRRFGFTWCRLFQKRVVQRTLCNIDIICTIWWETCAYTMMPIASGQSDRMVTIVDFWPQTYHDWLEFSHR